MNFAQVIVNSLITASELGLIAIGLTLTFSLLKFGNFAHVEMAVAGAYTAWALNTGLGLSFALSLPIAAIVMGFFGIVVDRAIFRVFRNAGDIAPMIASTRAGDRHPLFHSSRSSARISCAMTSRLHPA